MLADNEQEMSSFLSQSPLIKLLDEDFPYCDPFLIPTQYACM